MGCDIHAYLEYDEPDSTMGEQPHKGTPFQYAEHFGRVSIHRNYFLFGILAGVRDNSVEPVSLPRGLPERLSWNCLYDLILRVVDPKEDNEDNIDWVDNSEGFCRREDADKYEATAVKYRENAREKNLPQTDIDRLYYGYCDETKAAVYHPDWHSHSWLSLFDIKEVVKAYEDHKERQVKFHDTETDGPIPEGWKESEGMHGLHATRTMIESEEPQPLVVPSSISALVGAMEGLLRAGCDPRLVFWFDN